LMPQNLKLVLHFLLHMLIASVLFGAVASFAVVLWWFTKWLESLGVPTEIALGMWAATELLFWLDVLCFAVFVIAEVWKLLREIIRTTWRTGDGS